jgi:hypothetical protein
MDDEALTVAQLIEKLQAMPQDMPVKFDVASAGQVEGLVGVWSVDIHEWRDEVVLSS